VTPYPLGLDAEFSPEERQAFENTVVDLGDGLEPNAASLIIGWAAHDQRLHDERLTSLAENRDVWNAHDWVGAMNIRGFAERALEVLSEDVRTKAQNVVNRYDDVLMSFTEPDERALLRRFAQEDAGEGWWWDRVPTSGPVHDELIAFGRRAGI
jgi:hypothetical protein